MKESNFFFRDKLLFIVVYVMDLWRCSTVCVCVFDRLFGGARGPLGVQIFFSHTSAQLDQMIMIDFEVAKNFFYWRGEFGPLLTPASVALQVITEKSKTIN